MEHDSSSEMNINDGTGAELLSPDEDDDAADDDAAPAAPAYFMLEGWFVQGSTLPISDAFIDHYKIVFFLLLNLYFRSLWIRLKRFETLFVAGEGCFPPPTPRPSHPVFLQLPPPNPKFHGMALEFLVGDS